MPNYDYVCPTCKDKKLVSHSIHVSHTELCANCKVEMIKGFSAPLVTFKGGGWGSSS